MKFYLYFVILIFTLFCHVFVLESLADSTSSNHLVMIIKKDNARTVKNILREVIEQKEKLDESLVGNKEEKMKLNRFKNETLQYCRDDELGIRILCNPQWHLRAEDKSLLLIISQNPRVTMEIAKLNKRIKSLNQLNRFYFEDVGYYAEGFATEKISLDDLTAIKVKAYSKDFPQIRIIDYYFLRGEEMYVLFFSVDPQEKWNDFKFLIEKVAKSVKFI